MNLQRLCSTRWLIWLAGVVLALASLAPTVSRALASHGSSGWVEICTISGTQWMQIQDGEPDPASVSDQPMQTGVASLNHCPLCVLHLDRPALPVAEVQPALLVAHEGQSLPLPTYVLPCLPSRLLLTPPPRGPPVVPASLWLA